MPANHRVRGTCSFPDCGKPHQAKALCKGHYTQLLRGQDLRPIRVEVAPRVCDFPGCGRPHRSRGLCTGHAQQASRGLELVPIRARVPRAAVCQFDGCDSRVEASGWCRAHYQQVRRGAVLKPVRKIAAPGSQVGCSFAGCDREHHAKGLCAAHMHQVQRGQELRPIGERRTGAGHSKKGPRKGKKAPKPGGVLPPGWGRPLPVAKPKLAKGGDTRQMVVNPTDPRVMAAALLGLRERGADDVAEALGLTPDRIRAEAQRWALWQGAVA